MHLSLFLSFCFVVVQLAGGGGGSGEGIERGGLFLLCSTKVYIDPYPRAS